MFYVIVCSDLSHTQDLQEIQMYRSVHKVFTCHAELESEYAGS